MLVTEITLCWWRMHLHQLVYILFQIMAVKFALALVSVSSHFSFVFCPELLGITFRSTHPVVVYVLSM
jgi:hypothetical protein